MAVGTEPDTGGRPGLGRTTPPRVPRSVAGSILWPLAVASLLHVLVRSATRPGSDFDILWQAAARAAAGAPLYDPLREFIYPPLAGWVLAPLGTMPYGGARATLATLSLAALVTATLLLLRTVGVATASPVTAATLLLLSQSRPVVGSLGVGNLDVILLLVEVGVIGLLLAGRDVAAGALLGVSCAVKPALAPVVLALLLLGRARAALLAVGLAGALTVVALALVPDREVFFREIVPLLAGGNREVLAPYDRSLHAAAQELGLPPALEILLRVAAFTAAVALAWARRRGRLAPLEVVPLVMLGTLISSSFSWANYSIYLLPLLVTVLVPGSLVRGWPSWGAVYLLATLDGWRDERLPDRVDDVARLLPLWGWLLLLATCWWAAGRGPASSGGREGPALLDGLADAPGIDETADPHAVRVARE